MLSNTYLVPLLPLISFIVLIFFGFKLKEKSAYLSISAMGVSAGLSIWALLEVISGKILEVNWVWLTAGRINIPLGFVADQLSSAMLAAVCVIATLIQIYSIGYMQGDKRYPRYYAYMSLFAAAMLGLVISNNFLQLYICWELVGVCSYLLISFWFEKKSAALAGKKAFITTRIGDAGLFIGMLLLFSASGTFVFSEIFQALPSGPLLLASAILIFCGAIGKSAQFPLHVWLPDAMEGPTPVSALIHAATMVAAGVYLVARVYPIFYESAGALWVVAVIGTITLLLGGTIALVMNDIKRIVAYSTISQLGYMMLGLGVGGYTAGVFHLLTHAFFKALLFLCAGSVIHAVHTQDITQMGALRKKMPVTFWAFMFGTLALVGIPPFSGFFSKDEILLAAFHANLIIYLLALLGVVLTAFYAFRLIFLTFFGEAKEELHAHESPAVMTVPLVILSAFALGSGWVVNSFHGFIHFGHHEALSPSFLVMSMGVGAALLGILLAWLLYIEKAISAEKIKKSLYPLYVTLKNKYWFDEIYNVVFVSPVILVSKLLFAIDKFIVDGLVNLAGSAALLFSKLNRLFDVYIIDGSVNLAGWLTYGAGKILRRLQNGFVQTYTALIFAGLILLTLLQFIF